MRRMRIELAWAWICILLKPTYCHSVNLFHISIMIKKSTISNTVALGAGCYWGTEKYIKKNFQQLFPNSIQEAKVGFMSRFPDDVINSTGHVEVLNVKLNNPKRHFKMLIRFFFQFHDPTTINRQGNDRGSQYASIIFCSDEKQIKIVRKVIAELQDHIDTGRIRSCMNDNIQTLVTKSNAFCEAHSAHQNYLIKNPYGYW